MFRLTPYQANRNLRKNYEFDPFYKMIDDFFSETPTSYSADFSIDIQDNKDNYLIEAELPGVNKEDIVIDYKDSNLVIKVETSEEKEENEKNYIRRERKCQSMQRAFYVKDIKADEITAKLDNGILTILAPKAVELDNSYKIEIQ